MTRVALVICLLALCSGCMSTGGVVIGPFSAMSARYNEAQVRERAAYAVEAPKRTQVVRAVRAGLSDGEIAAGVGVDLLAIKEAVASESLTAGELTRQTIAALGDAAGYIALGVELRDRLDKEDKASSPALPSVAGNGNTVIYGNSAAVSVDNSRVTE